MKTNADVQRALIALDYDLGRSGPFGKGDDGLWGGLSRKAMLAYQKARGLKETGLPDAATLRRLFPDAPAAPAILPPWYAEMLRRKGLHEVRNRSALMAWLRGDGKTLGDPAKLPWCGDAVETAIHLTLPDEPRIVNPYLARNWLKFGRPLATPALGAVLVFWRGTRNGTSGHVGFYAGEEKGGAVLHVLGGNQSDAITIARLGRDRLLGIRWPSTYALPTSGRVLLASNGAALSTNEA
jgi:uncharacterized protein (TIGR02594 family)